MAKVDVYNLKREKVGSVDLADEVFATDVKEQLFHEVVVAQLASRRAGTHAAKERSAVAGSSKKIYKQKGTGRARHGSIRAALTPGEAAWMDTPMYGRWVVSHLAAPLDVADLLDSHEFDAVAAGLRAVVDGVERWRDPASAA